MALFTTDLSGELKQIKGAIREVVREDLSPLLDKSISQASIGLSDVVTEASNQLQANIRMLSDEIHAQRSVTKEDIRVLIDYAAEKIGTTIDERVASAKAEVSLLLAEKISEIKNELQQAAVNSRKTLYVNVSISVAAALAMAAIGLIYRKITLNQLDLFSLFRVLLISTATGTGLFSLLKLLNNWRILNKTRKNVATVAIGYLGVLRPNGALGLFFVSVLLVLGWILVTFYVH
jgi:ABC-type transporter MlaC component